MIMAGSTLVSIVTPSYNQAGFIGDTLSSVANQTHPSVEHLVMDGGSTDETLDVLREYEDVDGYDLTWVSQPDEGQSDAINKGFDRTAGDIVAWLNSDDVYFDAGVIARVVDHFDRHDADVIYGDIAYIDQNSTITAVDVRPDFDRAKLPYRILIGQPATFFRRDVVEAERLDTDLEYSMDYEYWLRLAQRFEFRHVQDVLAGFRSYPEQKSQDQAAMAAELETILTTYTGRDVNTVEVISGNLTTEVARLIRGVRVTVGLHRAPPELAFDGDIAPLVTMLSELGPGLGDVTKAWRRWRSGGASG
jgi:glycosyltransferase involved in cell wall biosynthesis